MAYGGLHGRRNAPDRDARRPRDEQPGPRIREHLWQGVGLAKVIAIRSSV